MRTIAACSRPSCCVVTYPRSIATLAMLIASSAMITSARTAVISLVRSDVRSEIRRSGPQGRARRCPALTMAAYVDGRRST